MAMLKAKSVPDTLYRGLFSIASKIDLKNSLPVAYWLGALGFNPTQTHTSYPVVQCDVVSLFPHSMFKEIVQGYFFVKFLIGLYDRLKFYRIYQMHLYCLEPIIITF